MVDTTTVRLVLTVHSAIDFVKNYVKIGTCEKL